ncbi:MAG: hypothetical protein J6A21_10590 [Lentisphaeria bacterium]|nr:hypothetical protein [Lentisphaeria bacterium]
MSANTYTLIPDEGIRNILDSRIRALSGQIGALHLPCLAGVVLGGGYGRGEGGVLHTPEGGQLYNDLDFFVFTRGAGKKEAEKINGELKKLALPLEKELGVAVDFGPAKELVSLKKVQSTLMFQELLRGWKPVWGEIRLEEYMELLDAERLPCSEAIRLLLNRGMGLLFAGERLLAEEKEKDADFIVRNMNKAILGGGDACLIISGQYCWKGPQRVSSYEKLVRAKELPGEYVSLYEKAFRWKMEPKPVLPENPLEEWKKCRAFYLDCVRFCSGIPEEKGEDTRAVFAGLRKRCGKERGIKNFLRWTLRAKKMRPISEIFDVPVVTVLGLLYRELSSADGPVKCLPVLRALWTMFN